MDDSTPAAACPMLTPLGRHKDVPQVQLSRPVIVVGSGPAARLRITSASVSRTHAIFVQNGCEVVLRDLVSRNGTFVNKQRIREQVLHDGDVVQVGDWAFRFGNNLANERKPVAAAKVRVDDVLMKGHTLLIGSREGCDVVRAGAEIAPAHAIVLALEDGHHLRDLGWGTKINGDEIHQQRINDGDEIEIAGQTLTFHLEELEDDGLIQLESDEDAGEIALEEPAKIGEAEPGEIDLSDESAESPAMDEQREAEAFDDLLSDVLQPGEESPAWKESPFASEQEVTHEHATEQKEYKPPKPVFKEPLWKEAEKKG